jgi:hypothetical protein
MSMIGEYARVTRAELDRALREPEWALEYVEELEEGYHHRHDSVGADRMIDIDKAWNGIWYLLNAAGAGPVDPVAGGVQLSDDDWGYGPPRYLTPDEVAEAVAHLSTTPWETLAKHFDPARMDDEGIYPLIWVRDGDDALDFLRPHYEVLTSFFAIAADTGDAIILWLG